MCGGRGNDTGCCADIDHQSRVDNPSTRIATDWRIGYVRDAWLPESPRAQTELLQQIHESAEVMEQNTSTNT